MVEVFEFGCFICCARINGKEVVLQINKLGLFLSKDLDLENKTLSLLIFCNAPDSTSC
jgi:hypothetical protein